MLSVTNIGLVPTVPKMIKLRFHFYKEDENFREKIQHWRAWVVERNELALLKIVDSCLECIPQLILSV